MQKKNRHYHFESDSHVFDYRESPASPLQIEQSPNPQHYLTQPE
jgi:hypothetical protein